MADMYKVLSQRQNIELAPGSNTFRHVWEIAYEVTDGPAKGTHAMVTVSDADHNAAYVDKTIRAKIDSLHGIAGL